MSEVKVEFLIRVGSSMELARCSVELQADNSARRKAGVPDITNVQWTNTERIHADRMVHALLNVSGAELQVMEEGTFRNYRVPVRIKDGWSTIHVPA